MEEQANQILDIITDYRNDTGEQITTESIMAWGTQFGDDAEFMLAETQNILSKTYVSKATATKSLKKQLEHLQSKYKYHTMIDFISNVYFIDVQSDYKSQKAILAIVKEILVADYDITYDATVTIETKKHYVYFDDVLATGGTAFNEFWAFLAQEVAGTTVANEINAKNKTFVASYFCIHTLGMNNILWRLKYKFDDKIRKSIHFQAAYQIENESKWDSQKLNFAIPIDTENPSYNTFLVSLGETTNNALPYRRKNFPQAEGLFSSPENRIKYETLIMDFGLSILAKLGSQRKANQRPLGFSSPSHKSFGTGTLFFTWRNIPNNCPLIFWWEVNGHNWTPLFTLQHRG